MPGLAWRVLFRQNYLNAFKQYDPANADSAHIVDGLVKGLDRSPTRKIDDIVEFMQSQSRRLMVDMASENEQAHRTATYSLLGVVNRRARIVLKLLMRDDG